MGEGRPPNQCAGEVRDSFGAGWSYYYLGRHLLGQGRSALAALDLERAAEMLREAGDARGRVLALFSQAAAFQGLGLLGGAAAALAVAARLGSGIGMAEPEHELERLLTVITESAKDGIEQVRQLRQRIEQDPKSIRQTALAALNHDLHGRG